MPLSLGVIRGIRRAHAEQLARFKLPTVHLPQDDFQFVTKEELLCYIGDNAKAVHAAQESQCKSSSPDKPHWDSVFFSLIESSAVNLRKDEKIAAAIAAARAEDWPTADRLIMESQEDIDEIARNLDCTFVQLCEFSRREPDGLPKHCGAYGGVFISNATSKPFMGIAFKGTTLRAEQHTDFDYVPIIPPKVGVAFDAETHRGFYHGLFGSFSNQGGSEVPFDHLMDQLDRVHKNSLDSLVHFTGHSLGAAYCTLTFAEFLRRQRDGDERFLKYFVGDMYILGAPRVSQQPFADYLETLTPQVDKKYVFRIVNKDDPICTVPPIKKKEFLWYPYVHVDGGWHLLDDGPCKMPTEQAPDGVPVAPLPVPSRVEDIPDHLPKHYYAGWQKTPHS